MLEKVKISVDVMGGDKSPDKTLEGINLFIKRNQSINDCIFYLFGNETLINQKLKNYKYIKNNYKVFDTKIVVTDELSAISSIKKGKNSSMWNAIQSQIDLSRYQSTQSQMNHNHDFVIHTKKITRVLSRFVSRF